MRRMIRYASIALLAAAIGSCSMFDYSGVVTHKYALVYGVTRYTTGVPPATPTVPSPPNLLYPENDANQIAAVLQGQGYNVSYRWVDASGTVWITGNQNMGPIGWLTTSTTDGSIVGGTPGLGDPSAPSKVNIINDISGLAGTVGPNDVLLIYFSGHGTQDTSTTPPHEYFDPYGSVMQYTADGNYYDFPVPSVRDDELASAFAAIKTPRKVLVLDTCNSGGFIGNQLEVDWTPPAYMGGALLVGPATLFQAISNYFSMQSSPTGLSPYGAQVLSAAGRDEECYETTSLGDGVMTYYLLQGLRGSQADLNHDGHVTVLEAFSYAKAGIDQNWNPNESGYTFEPHISGGPVDFVLF